MKKIVVIGALAVIVAGSVVSCASAGWFGWGEKPKSNAPVMRVIPPATAATGAAAAGTAAAVGSPVQIPSVSAVLPEGHPLQIQPSDRVVGREDAPVTMIEYASLTCPHCKDFHEQVLPLVKKDWIDSGKVKYVLRDLPWDNLALGMAKVARCAPREMHFAMVSAFFRNQEAIVSGVDTLGEIKKVSRLGGLDGAKVEECVQDEPLQAEVLGMKDVALNQLKIKGTPTTFVNGTEVDGAVKYEVLKKALEGAYKAALIARAENAKNQAAAVSGSVAAPVGVVGAGTPVSR